MSEHVNIKPDFEQRLKLIRELRSHLKLIRELRIQSDAELECAEAMWDQFWFKAPHLSAEEQDYFEIVDFLIDSYEKKTHPGKKRLPKEATEEMIDACNEPVKKAPLKKGEC